MFPWSDYHAGNIDWLLELTGAFDQRLLDVESKNKEQDGRLDEDDVLIAGLRSDLTTETTNRVNADNALSDRITSEVSARIAGDTRLQENIDAEASARQSADSTLQTNINNEATARANADTTLQNNINAEATARQNGDNTLQTNLNAAITNVMANLQQEQTNRITMDEGLQAMINTETTNRTNADTALSNRINAVLDAEVITVDSTGNPPVWSIDDDTKWNDLFDNNKRVVVYWATAGIYFYRVKNEVHGNTKIAKFAFLNIADGVTIQDVGIVDQINSEQFTFNDVSEGSIKGITKDTVSLDNRYLDIPEVELNPDPTGATFNDASSIRVGDDYYYLRPHIQRGGMVLNFTTATAGGVAMTKDIPAQLDGYYMVGVDLSFTATGNDTSDITWTFEIEGQDGAVIEKVSSDTCRIAGQFFLDTATATGIKVTAKNATNDFTYKADAIGGMNTYKIA